MLLKTGCNFRKHSSLMIHLKQQRCKIFHQWRIEKLNFRLNKHISQKIKKPYSSTEKDGLLVTTILPELISGLSKNDRMKRF